MEHIAIVSSAGHIGTPYSGYSDYIDPQFLNRLRDFAEEQQFYETMLSGFPPNL